MSSKFESRKFRLPNIGQDWAAVVLGFLVIGFVIAGYNIASPSIGGRAGWSDLPGLITALTASTFFLPLLATFVLFLILALFGNAISGEKLKPVLTGFAVVFILSLLAQMISSFKGFRNFGLETVLFSLLLGLLVGNLGVFSKWKYVSQTELFVKIGLVLLGANILFTEILAAGSFGLIQALFVAIGVWYFAFWIARKLKVDDEYATMLASAVSICGVSAAIATAGAINGDKKKLSVIISLVLIVAIPMMIFMPMVARWIGLPDPVTGAWLGGTIDTTGAVVAAGTIVGETGLKYATVVKFSQNVLLGFAAFAISIFWAYRKNETAKQQGTSLKIIWERFPKFVIGFLAASLLFSFLLDPETVSNAGRVLRSYSSLWFSLAFVSIGLETKFADLKAADNKRPIYSFIAAQGFNIIFTLMIAYILFGVLRS